MSDLQRELAYLLLEMKDPAAEKEFPVKSP